MSKQTFVLSIIIKTNNLKLLIKNNNFFAKVNYAHVAWHQSSLVQCLRSDQWQRFLKLVSDNGVRIIWKLVPINTPRMKGSSQVENFGTNVLYLVHIHTKPIHIKKIKKQGYKKQ